MVAAVVDCSVVVVSGALVVVVGDSVVVEAVSVVLAHGGGVEGSVVQFLGG